jgi:hypothetical protein
MLKGIIIDGFAVSINDKVSSHINIIITGQVYYIKGGDTMGEIIITSGDITTAGTSDGTIIVDDSAIFCG